MVEGANEGVDLEALDPLDAALSEDGGSEGVRPTVGCGEAGGVARSTSSTHGDAVAVGDPRQVGGRGAEFGGDVGERPLVVEVLASQPGFVGGHLG